MSIFNSYFRFPLVMIDHDYEEKKEEGEEITYIIGESEVCLDDTVLRIEDRWLPSTESFEKAQDGDFEACEVLFERSGRFNIAWRKDVFKKLYEKHKLKYASSVIRLDDDGLKTLIDKLNKISNDESNSKTEE